MTPAAAPALAVQHLTKRYGDRLAVVTALLVIADLAGWRLLVPLFDRERLISR